MAGMSLVARIERHSIREKYSSRISLRDIRATLKVNDVDARDKRSHDE
jgi:hypothetical protein